LHIITEQTHYVKHYVKFILVRLRQLLTKRYSICKWVNNAQPDSTYICGDLKPLSNKVQQLCDLYQSQPYTKVFACFFSMPYGRGGGFMSFYNEESCGRSEIPAHNLEKQ